MSNFLITAILILILGAIGYDIKLAIKKQETISQKIHKMFPQKIDYIIMGSILLIVWRFFGGWEVVIPMGIGVLIGHLFWHDD